MASYSPKYSTGDNLFYVLKSTREIRECEIMHVRILSPQSTAAISYQVKVISPNRNCTYLLDLLPEDELMSFEEAKTKLLEWLDSEKVRVAALISPVH